MSFSQPRREKPLQAVYHDLHDRDLCPLTSVIIAPASEPCSRDLDSTLRQVLSSSETQRGVAKWTEHLQNCRLPSKRGGDEDSIITGGLENHL